ncbi:MAG: hypothetical protein AAFW97_14680 [Pseudomonadota bacterium]
MDRATANAIAGLQTFSSNILIAIIADISAQEAGHARVDTILRSLDLLNERLMDGVALEFAQKTVENAHSIALLVAQGKMPPRADGPDG